MKYRSLFLIPLFFIFLSCASIKKSAYYVPEAPVNEYSDDDVIRIVHISDLHSNDYGKNQSKLVNKILELNPDFIVFTGDIFEYSWKSDKSVENVRLVLEQIKDICPFYYISGNHEYYEGHNCEDKALFEEYGGIVLENKVASTEIKGVKFVIAGVFDPISTVNEAQRITDEVDLVTFKANLDSVAKECSETEGDCFILLAHRPEYIDDYKSYGIYDLILSGHAHGGQWRIPPFNNGLYSPGEGWFPKYAGGRYDFEENKTSTFIISRGLSYQVPAIPRFFNRVELVEILVQAKTFRK